MWCEWAKFEKRTAGKEAAIGAKTEAFSSPPTYSVGTTRPQTVMRQSRWCHSAMVRIEAVEKLTP